MWRSGVGDLSNKKGGMSRSDRELEPLFAKKAVLSFVGPPPHVLPGGLGDGRKNLPTDPLAYHPGGDRFTVSSE